MWQSVQFSYNRVPNNGMGGGVDQLNVTIISIHVVLYSNIATI